MPVEPDPQLTATVHRALRRLPDLEAPATLAPRVLAAIEARARSWWRQPWWQWPLAAKTAFLTLAILTAGLLASGGLVLGERITTYSQPVITSLPQVSTIESYLTPVFHSLSAFLLNLNRPLLLALLFFVAALYLLCVGLGSMMFRVAAKRW